MKLKKYVNAGKITYPNNKTGPCPKCQKNVNNVVAVVRLAGILVCAKKYGPKLVKSAVELIKKDSHEEIVILEVYDVFC